MEISALTRSVSKRNYALICPDGHINSNIPGWTNCRSNVIINEQMGAAFCQTLITANQGCELKGRTKTAQIFFYLIKGELTAQVGTNSQRLKKGGFAYISL